MAFLEADELKSVIYEYQLSEITEGDDDITEMAISAAIEEMKGYLTPGKHSGIQYDVEAIFGATDDDRNALVLAMCKSIALFYVCQLSNVDIIEEKVKDRYDRAIKWLDKISSNSIYGAGLPVLEDPDENADLPFRMGSREKFNHE